MIQAKLAITQKSDHKFKTTQTSYSQTFPFWELFKSLYSFLATMEFASTLFKANSPQPIISMSYGFVLIMCVCVHLSVFVSLLLGSMLLFLCTVRQFA